MEAQRIHRYRENPSVAKGLLGEVYGEEIGRRRKAHPGPSSAPMHSQRPSPQYSRRMVLKESCKTSACRREHTASSKCNRGIVRDEHSLRLAHIQIMDERANKN